MAILGLLGTEQFADERFKSVRRSVFYQYPNGAAPLLGLLSMLDGEVLNDPEFSWYEKRLQEKVHATSVNGTTSGFWYADSTGALGAALATTAASKVAGTVYWIKVNSFEHVRINDILKIKGLTITGGTADIQLRVVAHTDGVYSSTSGGNFLRVTPLNTVTIVTNDDPGNDGLEVQVLGNAAQQGQTGAAEGSYTLPSTVGSQAQIFRTPYSFTGTALKTSAKFDESGPYKDKAKEHSMSHMIQMELQFLFGEPSKSVGANGLPTYTTGGVLFFMRLWEVGDGNVLAGQTNGYHNTAATLNADDNKRIININGNISESSLDDYYERLFRYTNNVANEKIAFVGSGFLNVMNKLYKGKVELTSDLPLGDTYGMNVVKHVCPFGTVFYKTHPLFSRNASMRYNALFMDVQNLKYRYMQDRDTEILKNRQPNNADYREDEWLTEAGLEMQYPESFMYMVGVTGTA
tara:strand:- start:25446 stop:26834 length:1389 start_codon:yes stop_codon:yes gene_type:complete